MLKKKMFIALIAVAIVFSGIFIANAEEFLQDEAFALDAHEYLISVHGEKFIANQNVSLQTHTDIINSFPRDRFGRTEYPDFFGGVYIDDNGLLVTLLVEGSSSEEYYQFRSAIGANLNTRTVEFSYNELVSTMSEINRIANADINRVFGIADSYGLGIIENRVVVRLANYNQEQIDLFRNTVLDSPILSFAQSYGPIELLILPAE